MPAAGMAGILVVTRLILRSLRGRGTSEPPHHPQLRDVVVVGRAKLVPPVLVLDAEKELVGGASHRLANIPPELRLRQDPALHGITKLVDRGADVLGMAGEPERLAADVEGGAPTDVEHKAVARPGRPAASGAAAGIDEGGQVGVQKHEAWYAPGEPHAGQILQDVGIAVDVDAADEGDVPDGPTADHPVRQLPEAQRRIPLAVEVLVVEAIGGAVVEDVDEDKAVAECPA